MPPPPINGIFLRRQTKFGELLYQQFVIADVGRLQQHEIRLPGAQAFCTIVVASANGGV